MPSSAMNRSLIGSDKRTSVPVPWLRFNVSDGFAAVGWATAGALAPTVAVAIARAAKAVPRRARHMVLRMFILASSHRNDGDVVAARDANDWTGIGRRACRAGRGGTATDCAGKIVERAESLVGLVGSAGRDAAALEARDVTTRGVGRVAVARAIGHGEQHLALLRRVGVGRHLDFARGDRALEVGGIVGERAQ